MNEDKKVVHWLADSCRQEREESEVVYTINAEEVTCEKCLKIMRGKRDEDL